jgi:hypothetical protein
MGSWDSRSSSRSRMCSSNSSSTCQWKLSAGWPWQL